MPPVIATGLHRHRQLVAQTLHDDHVLHTRHLRERLVQHRLHRAHAAAAPGAVGGDDGARAAVLQARDQRLRTEAREQRHDDGANLQDREEGDEGFRQVGHVDAHHVALAHAHLPERAGEPAGFGVELGVAERALLIRILALPHQEGLVPHRRAAVAVDAVEHDVGGAADAPARPGLPFGQVQHLRVGRVETEVAELEHLLHQPTRIGVGARAERLEALLADMAQKGGEHAALDQLGGRRPVKRGVGYGSVLAHGFRPSRAVHACGARTACACRRSSACLLWLLRFPRNRRAGPRCR